jgi:hypothetical protein
MKYDSFKPFAQNLPELGHKQRSLTQEDWDIKEKLGQHLRNWDYRDELIMLALAKARARGVRPVKQPLSVYMANLDRYNSFIQKPNYGYADPQELSNKPNKPT